MRETQKLLATAAIAAILLPASAAAVQDQDGEIRRLKQEIEFLKQGQQAIQKSLQEIKQLLSQRPQPSPRQPTLPPNVTIDLAGKPAKGAVEAQLAIIEFFDYQ